MVESKGTTASGGLFSAMHFLKRYWVPLRERWLSVADLRFHILLLGLGTLLVLIVPQGRDVVATLADSWSPENPSAGWLAFWERTRPWWWFLAAVTALGLQSWLWARLLIHVRYRNVPTWRRDKVLVLLPRILGVVPFAAAAVALWKVKQGAYLFPQGLTLALLGVCAYLFYWKRYAIIAALSTWSTARQLFSHELPFWQLTRAELTVLVLSLATSLTSLFWLSLDPVTLPGLIGSAALAFLGFALVIPPVSVLIAMTTQQRFPVLTALCLVAFMVSGAVDNHDIRTLEAPAPPRASLKDAFDRWVAQAPRDPADPTIVPMVFVSAAGGASRAGIWTSATLQHLDREKPDFNRSVFAISAVSGGALGAVDYVASITADHGDDPRARAEFGSRYASSDFLAPAIGGFFYTDLAQRFVPLAVFGDRSWSIERGFEVSWDRECAKAGGLARCKGLMSGRFLDLWSGTTQAWRPNLLLVGTVEEDGRRIVTSNLALLEQGPGNWSHPVLPNSYDFFDISEKAIRTSTAVMNSARFTWISPAGSLRFRGAVVGHVIDGGYFESSGADTSVDLMTAITPLAQDLCDTKKICVRPIFLTLINDEITDAVGDVSYDPCQPLASGLSVNGGLAPTERTRPIAKPRSRANDLIAPLVGLFSTQDSRAEVTLARLARQNAFPLPAGCGGASTRAGSARPIPEIRLVPCRMPADRAMAMSWVLSAPTRKRVQDQLNALHLRSGTLAATTRCRLGQQLEMARLAAALGIPKTSPEAVVADPVHP